jgi:hypothetical protein
MRGLNATTKSGDLLMASGIKRKVKQKLQETRVMKRLSKVIYGLLVPAIVALLAIACNASAVWGS